MYAPSRFRLAPYIMPFFLAHKVMFLAFSFTRLRCLVIVCPFRRLDYCRDFIAHVIYRGHMPAHDFIKQRLATRPGFGAGVLRRGRA